MPYTKNATLPASRSSSAASSAAWIALGAALRRIFRRSSSKRATALQQFLARYDAVRPLGNRRRRLMDRGSEESEFRRYDRMYAISLGRDMHRNQAKFVSLERTISRMTAGTVKCQLNTPDTAWNQAAEEYFNHTFAPDCLLTVPRTHLSELCQQLVASLIREGDALVVFDDGLARNSGRLLVYEADQLVTMNEVDFAAHFPDCYQEAGVILDKLGCIVGFITSAVRVAEDAQIRPNTLTVLPWSECIVYDADQAVLLAARYRPGQIRGVPEVLPVSIALDDADEMIRSELLTAKRAAKTFATISLGEASQNALANADLMAAFEAQEKAGNLDPSTGQIADPDAQPQPSHERPHYQEIDDNDSAIVTYLDGRDRLDIHDPQRPNLHTDEFYRSRNSDAAAALGLARGYAEMSVTNSYTAHRGESLLTWSSIYDRQKRLERTLLDWLAVKVIEYGVLHGFIPAPAASAGDWRHSVSWELPSMPPIDEKVAIEANAAALKSGQMSYRDLLGSDWKEKFDQLADELDYARSRNLPLSVLETVSGAPAEANPESQQENNLG